MAALSCPASMSVRRRCAWQGCRAGSAVAAPVRRLVRGNAGRRAGGSRGRATRAAAAVRVCTCAPSLSVRVLSSLSLSSRASCTFSVRSLRRASSACASGQGEGRGAGRVALRARVHMCSATNEHAPARCAHATRLGVLCGREDVVKALLQHLPRRRRQQGRWRGVSGREHTQRTSCAPRAATHTCPSASGQLESSWCTKITLSSTARLTPMSSGTILCVCVCV